MPAPISSAWRWTRPPSRPSRNPLGRRGFIVAAGVAVLAAALAAWRPVPAGVWHDDGVYVLLGRALADGHGLVYDGVVGAPPAVKFPPVYPVVLAALWTFIGGLGGVTLAAGLMNLAFVAGAASLLAWTLHAHAGLSRSWAFVAAVAGFASADLLRFSLIPLSEPLFLLLTVAALGAFGVATVGKPPGDGSPARSGPDREGPDAGPAGGSRSGSTAGPKRESREVAASGAGAGAFLSAARARLLVSALLVLAVLTRTAGVAVVVGVGAAALRRLGARGTVALLAPACVAAGAWGLWAAGASGQVPPELRDILGPYTGWLVRQAAGDPAGFLGRLPGHATAVLGRVSAFLAPGTSGVVTWGVSLPLLGLVLAGVRRSLRTHPALVWTAAAYALLLLAWPYVDRRLVSPLHPLLVSLAVLGGLELRRVVRPHTMAGAARAILVLWMLFYGSMSALRIGRGWPAAAFQIRAEALAAAVEALDRTVPGDAVVGAPEFWAALALHGRWTVAPSAPFAPAASVQSRPLQGFPEEQIRLWWSVGVDHVLLEQGGRVHGDALNLLEDRCPGGVRILARMPPQMLVRLVWSACPPEAAAIFTPSPAPPPADPPA